MTGERKEWTMRPQATMSSSHVLSLVCWPGKAWLMLGLHLGNGKLLRMLTWTWVLVAHICDPSSPGGRDQEDQGSKPAGANNSLDPILKNPITKKGWWSASKYRSWVQTPVPQKKKKMLYHFLPAWGWDTWQSQAKLSSFLYLFSKTATDLRSEGRPWETSHLPFRTVHRT
jgi:hypothetical protein